MSEFTYEELKEAANKIGYDIVKKREKVKIEQCVCGAKRGISVWYNNGNGGSRFCRCRKCWTTGPQAKTEREAKVEWNKMIQNLKNEEEKK